MKSRINIVILVLVVVLVVVDARKIGLGEFKARERLSAGSLSAEQAL